MAIVRWEPFRDLVSTQDRLNRLFNETFSRFFEEGESGLQAWSPAVDIYETADSIVVKAELPGIDPKDIECRIEDGMLYLKGERKFEKDVKKESYHHVERSYGAFTRAFTLPASVDPEKVKAEHKDGLLTLTMVKREEAKPKLIKINAAGETAKAVAARA